MWIYQAHLGVLVPRGLRPISPCPPPLPKQQTIIAILRSRLRGPDYKSFRFFTLMQ